MNAGPRGVQFAKFDKFKALINFDIDTFFP